MSVWWYCNVCHAQNHEEDGDCQYCTCQGEACQRDNCSDPKHFAHETQEAGA